MAKIVIIDDEKYILQSLEEILSNDEHEVFSFSDGWKAIDFIRNQNIDLVICDIEMPTIKGFEIIEKLKYDLETAVIPFIFLSGLNKEYHIRRGMSLGADDYITKPFEAKTIIDSVRTRLEKSKKFDILLKNQVKDLKLNISSVLPHEMLTPLNGIIGPLQMLMEDLDSFSKDEINELLRVIFFCSKRLKSLASNLIFYVDLENRSDESKKNSDLIENTVELIKTSSFKLARDADREEDLKIDIDNFKIKMQIEDFKKLFLELVGNALKFSTRGNSVKISSENTELYYHYHIYDEGKGIEKELINKIDAYKQFNRKKNEQQGLGLGLYICYKIAEYYDIKISIDSKKDEFTRVTLSFPK